MRVMPVVAVLTLVGVIVAIGAPVAAQKGAGDPTLRVIGVPPGYESSVAGALNNRGEVVGSASSLDRQVPFFWSERTGFVLFTNGVSGFASDVNDRSEVVGWYGPAEASGFLWSERRGFAHLGDFVPRAINNRGHMIGECGGPEVAAPCYRTADGNVIFLAPADPSMHLTAIDLNDHDEVVGSYAQGSVGGGFYWTLATGLILIPPAPGTGLQFVTITKDGDIGGLLSEAGASKLWLWRRTSRGISPVSVFPEIPGAILNRRGIAVGTLVDPSAPGEIWLAHAWRLSDGSALNLHHPALGTESAAYDVNDRNQVAGVILTPQGSVAVVWQLPMRWAAR
jgi:hypothetical protein